MMICRFTLHTHAHTHPLRRSLLNAEQANEAHYWRPFGKQKRFSLNQAAAPRVTLRVALRLRAWTQLEWMAGAFPLLLSFSPGLGTKPGHPLATRRSFPFPFRSPQPLRPSLAFPPARIWPTRALQSWTPRRRTFSDCKVCSFISARRIVRILERRSKWRNSAWLRRETPQNIAALPINSFFLADAPLRIPAADRPSHVADWHKRAPPFFLELTCFFPGHSSSWSKTHQLEWKCWDLVVVVVGGGGVFATPNPQEHTR